MPQLAALPRIFALRRNDEPPDVLAWGLALPDGSAVTCWTDPRPGAGVMVSRSVDVVADRYAPSVGAHLVWHR